jgi:hypothetical protein
MTKKSYRRLSKERALRERYGVEQPAPRKPMTVQELLFELKVARWNALIPACARDVVELATAIRYTHPTKGFRFVSKQRLGIA